MTRSTRSTAAVAVRVRRLAHAAGLPLPAYQTDGAAGLDLLAAVPEKAPVRIRPRGRIAVPTGLELELPAGMEGQVRPRSGLALRDGITVLNAPGTIDSDYRGEVKVLLVNLGDKAVTIRRGDRIAQLVVAPVTRARLEVVVALNDTERGAGGFGSTGKAHNSRKPARKAARKTAGAAPMKKNTKAAAPPAARKRGARKAVRRTPGRRR